MALEGYPYALIGVDPGGTTGIAVFLVKDEKTYPKDAVRQQWDDWELVAAQLVNLGKRYEALGYNVVMVVEQFDKRPGISKPDFTPKFINQMIDDYVAPHFEVVYQIPAVAKNTVREARRAGVDGLKRFGWYSVGQRHSNDAARHLTVYLARTLKHLPTILKGWPKPDVY